MVSTLTSDTEHDQRSHPAVAPEATPHIVTQWLSRDAAVTGQPAPDAVPRFLGSPLAERAFVERLMQTPVSASYGLSCYLSCYYGQKAFLFTPVGGTSRLGRNRWPEAAEAYLSPDYATKRSADYLREEPENRRSRSAVLLQLAGDSDPTDDVTALWAGRPARGRTGADGGNQHLADGRS